MNAALDTRADIPDFAHLFAREQGGRVRGAARLSGGSSREIWVFEVTGAGGTAPFVLHREGGGGPFFGTRFTLRREATTLRAVRAAGHAVPRVHAVSDAGDMSISDCLPGRADFTFTDDAIRLRTIDDFARHLHALHARDARTLGLPRATARTRADATRADLDDHAWAYRRTAYREPLVDAALAWLQAALPADDAPPSMLQGDAGPTNFVHADGGLTGFIDWEMAHAGDPHDDLAWVWFRVSVLKLDSDVRPWFEAYRRHSGVTIDPARLDYFVVAVMLRCAIANIVRRHNDGDPSTERIAKTLAWLAAALARARGGDTAAFPPRGLDTAVAT